MPMEQRLELALKGPVRDVAGEALASSIRRAFGVETTCRCVDAYNLGTALQADEMARIASEVFADGVVQDYSFMEPIHADCWRIEIGLLPGVTDNIGHTAAEAIHERIGKEIEVYHSLVYAIKGPLDESMCERIAATVHNPLIEKFTSTRPGPNLKRTCPR